MELREGEFKFEYKGYGVHTILYGNVTYDRRLNDWVAYITSSTAIGRGACTDEAILEALKKWMEE